MTKYLAESAPIEVPLTNSVADTAPPIEVQAAQHEAIGRIFERVSARAAQVLTMIGEGYTAQEIADELGVGLRTAERYMADARREARDAAGDWEEE